MDHKSVIEILEGDILKLKQSLDTFEMSFKKIKSGAQYTKEDESYLTIAKNNLNNVIVPKH